MAQFAGDMTIQLVGHFAEQWHFHYLTASAHAGEVEGMSHCHSIIPVGEVEGASHCHSLAAIAHVGEMEGVSRLTRAVQPFACDL